MNSIKFRMIESSSRGEVVRPERVVVNNFAKFGIDIHTKKAKHLIQEQERKGYLTVKLPNPLWGAGIVLLEEDKYPHWHFSRVLNEIIPYSEII